MIYATKKIGEVCQLNPRKSEIKDMSEDLFVSFIPMSAVNEYAQEITFFDEKPLKDLRKGYTYFKNKDILFAKITPCMENGKVAIAKNLKNGIGFGTTEFHVIRATKQVLPEWIYYIVRQPFFREIAKDYMTGSAGQKRVPIQFLENYEIPLPPLPEQKKIVKKIEELFGKIDQAQKLRKEAKEATANLLSAELHKIFEEGKKKGWDVEHIKDICEKVQNINPKEIYEKEFKYIDISSINTGKGIEEYKVLSATGNIPSRARRPLKTDDVLFALTRPYLKNIAYVTKDYNDAVASTGFSIMRARKDIADPKYLYFIVNSDWFMAKIIPLQTGATYPAVTESNVFLQTIPLPPLSEQKKIVARLDSLSAKIQELQKLQDENEKDLSALKQSILQKAFKGELV